MTDEQRLAFATGEIAARRAGMYWSRSAPNPEDGGRACTWCTHRYDAHVQVGERVHQLCDGLTVCL